METKKTNEKTNVPIIANGGAEKGPVKQFFARMLDKFGVSKLQERMAERRYARDSKCTYVMNVSEEDQKIIADIAKDAYRLNPDAFAAFNYNPYMDRFRWNL